MANRDITTGEVQTKGSLEPTDVIIAYRPALGEVPETLIAIPLAEMPTPTITASSVSNFTEAAQDAVGSLLTDSSELDFTYDDAGNAETLALKPTGVTPGSYTNVNVAVDVKGRITAISNGAAGGGGALDSYTISTAPDPAANVRKLVYFSDGADGSECLGFSNGTIWKRILLGAGIAAFNPMTIPGLITWLKADSLTLSDADPVSTWTDNSDLPNSPTGSGTIRPLFKTNVVNGLPAIRFDGTNDYLTFPTNIDITQCSIFVVCNRTGSNNPGALVVTKGVAEYSYIDGVHWGAYTGGGTAIMSDQVVGSSFRVLSMIVRASNDVDLFTENSHVTRTAGNGFESRAYSSVGGGATGSTGVELHRGDIAEVLIYNNVVSNTNRDAIIGYLKTKYAIA